MARRTGNTWRGAACLAALVCLAGCAERTLLITSEPTGADVTVNQRWKGKTPYALAFRDYGVFDIRVESPNYYPLHVAEPVKPPLILRTGVDFVGEVLVPGTIRDTHELHYVLEPIENVDDPGDVYARAETMREAVRVRQELRAEKDAQRRFHAPPLPLRRRHERAAAPDETLDDRYPDAAPAVPTTLPDTPYAPLPASRTPETVYSDPEPFRTPETVYSPPAGPAFDARPVASTVLPETAAAPAPTWTPDPVWTGEPVAPPSRYAPAPAAGPVHDARPVVLD